MHVEICACLRLLARLNYIMGDHPEVGITYSDLFCVFNTDVLLIFLSLSDIYVFTRRL